MSEEKMQNIVIPFILPENKSAMAETGVTIVSDGLDMEWEQEIVRIANGS